MKKFLVTILIFLMTSTAFAATMPDISAGETYFDFFSGCYILKGDVKVVHQGRTMTAKEAKAKVADQKVWASGNVTLVEEGIRVKCDKVFANGLKKSASVIGKVEFLQEDVIKVTCDVGKFSWDSKVADFYGNVKLKVLKKSRISLDKNLNVNIKKIEGTYDHIQYNIIERKFILLDKKYSPIPEMKYPEPDPLE